MAAIKAELHMKFTSEVNTMPYTYKIEQHNTISITRLIFEIITITVVGINNEHIIVLNNYWLCVLYFVFFLTNIQKLLLSLYMYTFFCCHCKLYDFKSFMFIPNT